MKGKHIFTSLMALILVLSLTACSSSAAPSPAETTAPPTEDPFASILAEADALMNAGDQEGAIALYAQAGPVGQQALETFRREYKLEFDELAENKYDLNPAIEYLQQLPEGLLDEETALVWYMQLFQPATDEHMERINGEYDFLTFSIYEKEEIQNRIDVVANSPIGKTAEAKALIDTNTFLLGIMEFTFAYETYSWDDPGFETAYQFFASCSEGSAGADCAQAIDMIREGNYLEAAELLTVHIVSQDRIVGILSRYSPRGENATLNNRLSYNRTIDIIQNEAIHDGSLETTFDGSSSIAVGISTSDGMTDVQREELINLCATAADGKVLILHRWSEFGTGEKKINLYADLIDMLPNDYYPSSLEQVEYVILLDSTYERTGAFENGTIRIHETTTLTLYNATTGEELYTASAEGLDDDYMYYFGEAPEFYSAGSPDMKTALHDALAIIANS